MGKPLDDMDEYDVYEDGDVKAYIRVDVRAEKEAIKVSYKKTLFRKGFDVDGVAV